MSKNPKRNVRFEVLHVFYQQLKAGIMDESTVKTSLGTSGNGLYEKELDKFLESYPGIDGDDFKAFIHQVDGILNASKRKTTSDGRRKGGGTGNTTLNTIENAQKLGVLPEHQERYVQLVNDVFVLRSQLNEILPEGISVSFSIPGRTKKAEASEPEQGE
jgi:hypothetical protein